MNPSDKFWMCFYSAWLIIWVVSLYLTRELWWDRFGVLAYIQEIFK
jgi:hypothetical protein